MTTQQRRRAPRFSIERQKVESQWSPRDGEPPTKHHPAPVPATNFGDGGLVLDEERGAPPAHVLVVEDEESFVDALTVNLEREGFVVTAARDGVEALERFAADQPDLVLLDVMLPRLSGIDVCRAIRAISTVPIIMVTAKSTELDTVVGLEVGADDYVAKPYRAHELVSRMRAVLRRAPGLHANMASGSQAPNGNGSGPRQATEPATAVPERPARDTRAPSTSARPDEILRVGDVVLDLGKPVTFNVVRVREYLPLGQRVDSFALDSWQDGRWTEFAAATSIGNQRLLRTATITSPKVRLRITKAAACPAISELGLFLAPAK